MLGAMAHLPELAKKIEQAGHGYADLQKRRLFGEPEEEKKGQDEGSDDDAEEELDDEARQNFERKNKKRTKEEIDKAALLQENLYELLGLAELSMEATEAQVAKAYRKQALRYHPDKLGDKITEKDKEIWNKIQKAYDTLVDPAKKKQYDSTLPFDDSVPKMEDIANDDEFFQKFGKCFARNAKFSVNKPVPGFGFGTTDMKDVNDFYRFWHQFKTWRTFNQYDEYEQRDIDAAEDRFEKRWMEKENKKCREKYDKAERKRVFNLVNLAYEHDPRIRAQREKEEAERQAVKAAKRAAAQQKHRDAEERQRELERRQKEAEEAEAKKREEEELQRKDAAKQYRATCKEFCVFCIKKMPGSKFDKFFIAEMVKDYATQAALDELFDQVRSFADATFESQFQEVVNAQAIKKEELNREKEAKKQEEAKKTDDDLTGKNWTHEDIANLTKAIVKFPPGTVDRWKVIGDAVGKTQREVIAKAKEIQARKQRDVEAKR